MMIQQWEYARKTNENECERAHRLNVIGQKPDDLFKPDSVHVYKTPGDSDIALCDCKQTVLFGPNWDVSMPCLVVEVDNGS